MRQNSSLSKKYWMGITGLFLCLFLLGHLFGNLQLLNPNIIHAKDAFNEYGKFMTTNPLIKMMSYMTYLSILFHIIDGIVLTVRNRKARDVQYVSYKGDSNSKWNSRNMGVLGTVVLVFIIIHMMMFWAEMKFGKLAMYQTASGVEVKDLYTLTVKSFQDGSTGLIWTIIYSISMLAVGFHLNHGFASAFQSLGISHTKYNKIIKGAGKWFSIIVPLLFAYIPFYIHFILEKYKL